MRALIFDLDGTLVDSYPAITWSLNHARARHHLAPLEEAEVRRMVGHGLESLIAQQVGPEHLESGVRSFREEYARVLLGGTRELPDALLTLRTLHARGYALAVASNKPADFSERILAHLGFLPLLGAVLGPEHVGAPKPDPAMLAACLEMLRVPAAGAVYVGDMVLDVESAARAQLAVVLVASGSAGFEELEATGQRVLRRLSELLTLLPEAPPGSPCAAGA